VGGVPSLTRYWIGELTATFAFAGKPLETAPTGQNHGKYSLENALMLKAYAGMQTLKENPRAKMH